MTGVTRSGFAVLVGLTLFASPAATPSHAARGGRDARPVRPARGMFWQEFSWSADGRHMLLTGMNLGTAAVYIARSNGTDARALTDTSRWSSWGSWSPDGLHIAYAARVDSVNALFVMSADGSGARRITQGSANDQNPDWSPESGGERIAFVSNRGGSSAIWTVNADGASPTRLCDLAGTVHNPVWSPDGRRLAFYFTHDGADSIAVMNADGTNLTVIGKGVWPHWSRDGSRLVYTSGPRGRELDIWVINADGTGRTRVTGPGFFARWSPNGRDIVFLRAEGSSWPRPSFLYSVRPDGTRERRWPAH